MQKISLSFRKYHSVVSKKVTADTLAAIVPPHVGSNSSVLYRLNLPNLETLGPETCRTTDNSRPQVVFKPKWNERENLKDTCLVHFSKVLQLWSLVEVCSENWRVTRVLTVLADVERKGCSASCKMFTGWSSSRSHLQAWILFELLEYRRSVNTWEVLCSLHTQSLAAVLTQNARAPKQNPASLCPSCCPSNGNYTGKF